MSKFRILINGKMRKVPFYIINIKNRIDKKLNIINNFKIINIKNYIFFEAFDENSKIIQNIYQNYLDKFTNKNKIIKSIGAVGLIYSTIELFKQINISSRK